MTVSDGAGGGGGGMGREFLNALSHRGSRNVQGAFFRTSRGRIFSNGSEASERYALSLIYIFKKKKNPFLHLNFFVPAARDPFRIFLHCVQPSTPVFANCFLNLSEIL